MGIFIAGGVCFHLGISSGGSDDGVWDRWRRSRVWVVEKDREIDAAPDCWRRARAQRVQMNWGLEQLIVVEPVDMRATGGVWGRLKSMK